MPSAHRPPHLRASLGCAALFAALLSGIATPYAGAWNRLTLLRAAERGVGALANHPTLKGSDIGVTGVNVKKTSLAYNPLSGKGVFCPLVITK